MIVVLILSKYTLILSWKASDFSCGFNFKGTPRALNLYQA